ncbi:MAG TPA: penicillin-binding protein [Gemmatimonadales bacterium]|nr:penicillin-binding protein [Gemmatimonadales bacterium]
MAKPAARIAFLQVVLGLAAVAVVGRAFTLQVVQHRAWTARAEERDRRSRPLPAHRGTIYDRDGVPLAVSQETYRLVVIKNRIRDAEAARRAISAELGIAPEVVARRWRADHPYFHGPFTAEQVHPLRAIRGLQPQPIPDRRYPLGSLARPWLGSLDEERTRGVQGLELGLDTLLAGRPGTTSLVMDGTGRLLDIPGTMIRPPESGKDVLLTLHADLQGIVEGALRQAVQAQQAQGGDVVILDIKSGELLALASVRVDPATGRLRPTSSALVEPYEPGSTAKIFTAAAMLRLGADTSSVAGENGLWYLEYGGPKAREIRDVHKEAGLLSLATAIKYSSNVALSKFALRLRADSQFAVLRDFGFGAYPALGFPGEAPGQLPLPVTRPNLILTQTSWAQGYEMLTLAVQVAAGYAAIANGGTLLAPALVREVRDGPGGAVRYRHTPQPLRQVVSPAIARELMDYLRLATDSGGTGGKAQLDRFTVIGKTGTAKHAVNGIYTNLYRTSFAGVFPGDAPQVVIYVMIDRPNAGAIYGGTVSAPVVRTILQQALALPNSPLDRTRLAATTPTLRVPARGEPLRGPVRRVAFPLAGPAAHDASRRAVPNVVGYTMRDGIHQLLRAGLQVRLIGSGRIARLEPAPGDSVAPGTIITVHADAASR